MKKALVTLAVLAVTVPALAVPIVCEDYVFGNLNLPITDNSLSGVVNAQTIAGSQITNITDVDIDLYIPRVSGGWNGDLQVTLQGPGLQIAWLMNRVGTRATGAPGVPPGASSSVGYSDDGVDILLDDQAANDIHYYRFTIFGNHTGALASGVPLGADPNQANWQPDGRAFDFGVGSLDVAEQAQVVVEPRVGMLSVFNGSNANGVWTLSVSDRASGDTHKLDRWSIHVCGTPEPASLMLLGLAGLLIRRR